MLTDTDGLYTSDPRANPNARWSKRSPTTRGLADLDIGHAGSPLGSAGCARRSFAAEMATAAGITAVIANGLTGDALEAALREAGRHAPSAASAAYSSSSCGEVRKPSQGGARGSGRAGRCAKRHEPAAVGIVDVLGDFDAGDAVVVAERDGADAAPRPIGRASALLGGRAARIQGNEDLERARAASSGHREAVHRD